MRQQAEKTVRLRPLLLSGLIVLLAVVWLVWSQWERLADWVGKPPPEVATEGTPGGEDSPSQQTEAGRREELERRWEELTGAAPAWPEDFSSPRACDEIEQELLGICDELDSRPYVQDALGAEGTCGLLDRASRELASRPPVLASELQSYPAILSNAFHLFRVLGRERTALLSDVMQREDDLLEPMALSLYRWLASREPCAGEGEDAVSLEALYEYSGFLIHTLGGQAYLRRRSPSVEALTSFYALVILDRADELMLNRHGLDPRAEVSRCRELLRTRPLLFAQQYDEVLDQISRRWEARAAAP